MPNPMQRENDRNALADYEEEVARWRRLVELGEVDPRQPTHYGPGSREKMILLTLRDEMGLTMHMDGDSRECGHRPVYPSQECTKTPMGEKVSAPPVRRLMVAGPRQANMRAA